MRHVFISYARQDAVFAMELEDRLRGAGFQVWKDASRLDAGTEWASAIDAAVDGCDVLILVITPASMDSQYVNYEWARALGGSTPLLPVLLGDAKLHPRLEGMQFVDFRTQHCWEKLFAELGAARARKSDVPPVVRATMTFLDDPAPDRQLEGIRGLAEMDHPSARAALINALWHPSHQVRRLALLTLGETKTPEAAEALLRVLEDGSYPCRSHVLWALSEVPRPAAVQDALRKFVTAERPVERAAALRGLTHALDSGDISLFVQALDDPSEVVRTYACDGLKAFDKKALPQLLLETQGPLSDRKRFALATVLEAVGDDRAVAFLASVLHDETFGSLSWIEANHNESFSSGGGGETIGSIARRALDSIGTPAARQAITDSEKRKVSSPEKDSRSRRSKAHQARRLN